MQFEIVCVNDGSKDDILQKLIVVLCMDECVWVIDLICNFGKEVVLMVGIDEVFGDVVILIDVDL